MNAPWEGARELQRPPPKGALGIIFLILSMMSWLQLISLSALRALALGTLP